MKTTIVIALSVLLLVSSGCGPSVPSPPSYPEPTSFTEVTVTRVVSGDTIEVDIGGSTYTVKYLGIDAPGISEEFGQQALDENKDLVNGKVIRLEKGAPDTDSSGRLLRYVFVGDIFVNAELVRLGLAGTATTATDAKYQDLLTSMQDEAKRAGSGIWSDMPTTTPTAPGPIAPDTTPTTPPPRD